MSRFICNAHSCLTTHIILYATISRTPSTFLTNNFMIDWCNFNNTVTVRVLSSSWDIKSDRITYIMDIWKTYWWFITAIIIFDPLQVVNPSQNYPAYKYKPRINGHYIWWKVNLKSLHIRDSFLCISSFILNVVRIGLWRG